MKPSFLSLAALLTLSFVPMVYSTGAIFVTETFPTSTDPTLGYIHGQGLVENTTGFGTGWAGKWQPGSSVGSYITSQNTGKAHGGGGDTRTAFRTLASSVGGTGKVWFSYQLQTSNVSALSSLTFFSGSPGTPGGAYYPVTQEELWVGIRDGFFSFGAGNNSTVVAQNGLEYTLTGVIDYDLNKAVLWNTTNQAYAYYDPITGVNQGAVKEIIFNDNDPITAIRLAKTGTNNAYFDNIQLAQFGTDLGVVAPEPSVSILGMMGLSELALGRRRKVIFR